ncbi:hypothetical protein BS17DRAFT_788836 [Gyrodon lividus]|nr:hypothetical protein BS17DRAFT_788836 [Gyrodon lividus]
MANSVQAVCAAYHSERLAIQEREEEEMRRQEAVNICFVWEGREEGIEQGRAQERAALEMERAEEWAAIEMERAEERAAIEMEHAVLAAWERGFQRRIEELEAQSRGAATN